MARIVLYANLATGFGKSIVFQALPFFVYAMEMMIEKEKEITEIVLLQNCCNNVIVISPLTSLMKDQINVLSKRGIKAASFERGGNLSLDVSDFYTGYNIY